MSSKGRVVRQKTHIISKQKHVQEKYLNQLICSYLYRMIYFSLISFNNDCSWSPFIGYTNSSNDSSTLSYEREGERRLHELYKVYFSNLYPPLSFSTSQFYFLLIYISNFFKSLFCRFL